MGVAFRMTMLNSLRFYITLAGSTLVFLWCQKRRRWWGASMAAVFAFGVLGMTVTNYSLPNSNVKNLLVFGGAMLVVVAIALACFEVRWEEALFCAVAGYSVQFIISLCGEMGFRVYGLSSPEYFLLQLAITAAVLPLVYLRFGRKLKRGQNMDLDRRSLLPLVVGAVLAEVVLCYNMRLRWMTFDNRAYMMYDASLLILCSVFILVSQFALLVQRNLEDELKIINQLRRKDRDQYQVASETIDQINRKCHDMRHQIRTIGRSARVTPEALAEMEQTIDIYDSMVSTGCRALDIILTEKSLYCQKNNIVIRCIADGRGLSFLQDVDIYSLFGNLLDNALEACERMRRDECRFIHIQAKSVKKCFLIEVRNSMDRTEQFTEGFTNKEDSQEHGIGLLNVGDVVHGYDGVLNAEAENGIFLISVLMPFPDAAHDIKTAV